MGLQRQLLTLQDADEDVQVVPVGGADVVQPELLKQGGPGAGDHAASILVDLGGGFLRTWPASGAAACDRAASVSTWCGNEAIRRVLARPVTDRYRETACGASEATLAAEEGLKLDGVHGRPRLSGGELPWSSAVG